MMNRQSLFVGGEWVPPAGHARIDVISPSTEEHVGSTPAAGPQDVDRAVEAALQAHATGHWRRLTVEERGEYLQRMAGILESRLEEITRLQIDEMGAPYSYIRRTTAGRIAAASTYLADALSVDTEELRDGPAGKLLITRRPVGVAAAVFPWNAPVPITLGKMYAALLAGCPLILKPPPETPLSPNIVAEATVEAGFPPGVLSVLPGGRELGEYLIRHPGVSRVSFTGSVEAGRRVAAICGERLARATVELGGKSAAILLDDVDLDAQMPNIIDSSLPNTGQVCHATTRLLIPRRRSDEITERLVHEVSNLVVGDPHDANTDLGPLVAQRQRERVEWYIEAGQAEGAKLVCGGDRPPFDRGWFVEPTIFRAVDNSMKIAREEIFGPVLSLIEYDTVDEAVAIANDSDYGLGGAVFTADVRRGLEVARHLETGSCRINESPPGGAGGPFGGFKQSGIGRENGREGIAAFYEMSTISLPAGADEGLRARTDAVAAATK